MNALPPFPHRRVFRLTITQLTTGRCPVRHACLLLSYIWVLCLTVGGLRAQDAPTDNPDGPSGIYNGQVTTAGSYDPYTQNARRAVTDLVVPGSNGSYPLAFTRIYNSAMPPANGEPRPLGDGGNWRHSYLWTLLPLYSGPQFIGYNLYYPDGGCVAFEPGRSNAPSGEYSTYWRGPSGIQDRLEVPSSGSVCLHRSDGGLVCFGSGTHPSSIVDPYGATTTLTFVGNYLTQVVEPGGRSLTLNNQTITEQVYDDGDGHTQSASWTLLMSVQASTGQSVTYTYGELGGYLKSSGGSQPYNYHVPYKVLTSVTYNAEPSISGSGSVQAAYTYEFNGGGVPVITTASDPHYAGAMTSIRYHYTATGSGSIQEEQNFSSSQRVSNLSRSGPPTALVATETRGDTAIGGGSITRTFKYGETTVNGGASNAKASQLTTANDFQGNPTYLSYYAPGNANGEGNLFSVTDALGHATLYGHEPYAGKVYALQLPDNRVRYWNWLAKDLSTTLQPYYLYQYTDERGQKTTYKRYPNTGLLNEVDYPDGGKETYTYAGWTVGGNTFYKVNCYTDKRGAQTINAYDETDVNHGGSGQGHVGLLTSVTRSYKDINNTLHQERTIFYYDALDRLTQSTDPGGVSTQYTFNGRHQLLRTTHVADGTHTDNAYDDLGNCVSVSDELGHTATTTYDAYRRPLSVTVPVNDGTTATRTTSFVYDPRDQNSNSLSPALSHTRPTWSISWAPSGKGVERVYSSNGWQTYDLCGLVVSGSSSAGSSPVSVAAGTGFVYTQVPSYSAVGQVLTSTDAQGKSSTFTYDSCGRKLTATDPLGHAASWVYYGVNQPSQSTNYAGWLESVTTPGPDLSASNANISYAPSGTASAGTVTTVYNGYDPMGRVTSTVDPFGHTFTSGYDYAGDLTSQGDGDQAGGSHVTGYGFDQLGRTCSINDAASTGTKELWTYNPSGTVNTYTTFAGKVCTYAYDGRNRCIGSSWNDGVTSPTSFGFDAASRTTDVNNWHANVHYTLDYAGGVLSEQITHNDTGATGTTHYVHDADGNVTAISAPSGFCPYYYYDAQQRCTGAYAGNTTFSQYNFSGNWLTGRWLANGLYTFYEHQDDGRVWDVWHYRATNTNGTQAANGNIRHYNYGYEPDGQISWFDRQADGGASGSSLENGNGDAFAYYPDGSLYLAYRNVHYGGGNPPNNWPYQGTDGKGDSQMTISSPDGSNATADTYGDGFQYDAAGNRTNVTQHNAALPTYHPQGDNTYQGWSYDPNYNTTNAGPGWTYTYDSENHLVGATGPGGISASFLYDGLGRMCVFNVNGTFTRFYYAGSQRMEERDQSNNVLEDYMYDAPGSDQILLRQGQYGVQWYQYDLMGNTSHLSDGSGNVLEQYLYDAYGQPSVYDKNGNSLASSTYGNRYQFKGAAGYYWFTTLQAYYCRARFYLPQHGRWLQPDPIGQAGGLNIYTYCGNNPVNGVDPSGLSPEVGPPVHIDSGDQFSENNPFNDPIPIDIGTGVERGWSANNPYDGPMASDPGNSQADPGSGDTASNDDPGAQQRQGGGDLGPAQSAPKLASSSVVSVFDTIGVQSGLNGLFYLRGGGIPFGGKGGMETVVIIGQSHNKPFINGLAAVGPTFQIGGGELEVFGGIETGRSFGGGSTAEEIFIVDSAMGGGGVGVFATHHQGTITSLGFYGYSDEGNHQFEGVGRFWEVNLSLPNAPRILDRGSDWIFYPLYTPSTIPERFRWIPGTPRGGF